MVDFGLVSALRYVCVYLGCLLDDGRIMFVWNVYLRMLAHFDVIIVVSIEELCGELHAMICLLCASMPR